MRTKILIGILITFALSMGSMAFSIIGFNGLKDKIKIINEIYLPSLKTLGQIESQLTLFEQDFDKSMSQTGIRPKLIDLQSIVGKLESLTSAIEYEESVAFLSKIEDLSRLAKTFEGDVRKHFAGPEHVDPIELQKLYSEKSELKQNIRSIIRNIDRESQLYSIDMQKQMNSYGILATLMLAVSLMVSVILLFVIAGSLKPLGPLTELVQKITSNGFSFAESELNTLRGFRKDEIGGLAKDISFMLQSLKDRNDSLEKQRKNLESAHLEMARQNVLLKQTQSKLMHQEKLALVGKLTAQIAHEVRNPLNSLGLQVDLLIDNLSDNREAIESLHSIRNAVDRLNAITDSYLGLTKSTPSGVGVAFDIFESLQEFRKFNDPWIKGQGVTLEIDVKKGTRVKFDARGLQQILLNLVKNSLEAFGRETLNAKISIRVSESVNENCVDVVVADNGPGIKEADKNKVFSPYFTTKADGTGIGLSYCKQLIEAHSGSMDFSSREGRGTIFLLRLPRDGVENERTLPRKDISC